MSVCVVEFGYGIRLIETLREGAGDLGMRFDEAWTALRALQSRGLYRTNPSQFYQELVKIAAQLSDAPMCSLYLVEGNGNYLSLQANVGLPAEWSTQISRIPLDANTLPCGAAAARREAVIAGDLSDPAWAPYQSLAAQANIRAIWALPLLGDTGRPLGTFCCYYATPLKLPSAEKVHQAEYIARYLALIIELNRLNQTKEQAFSLPNGTQLLSDPYAFVHGILLALEARDVETNEHSRRVTTYTLLVAERLGFRDSQLQHIAMGAALHDIGKIGIPDRILHKPSKLSSAEMGVIRKHPQIGAKMLEPLSPRFSAVHDIVLHHHERQDGKGYPGGLRGGDIPLPARMFSVVDAFDAITSDRPYRPRDTIESARQELANNRGTQFCSRCLDAFLSLTPDVLAAVHRGDLDLTGTYLTGDRNHREGERVTS